MTGKGMELVQIEARRVREGGGTMVIAEFWAKAERIFQGCNDKFRATQMTGDEHYDNVTDFLSDMDALASEWYNCGNGEQGEEGK